MFNPKVVITGLAVGFILSFGYFEATRPLTELEVYEQTTQQVVYLLNPANMKSGGTGFAVKAPSGRTYTLTNHHICRMAENNYVIGKYGDREERLYVKAESSTSDLCILTPPTSMSGLTISNTVELLDEIYVVGHPALRPTTLSKGYVIGSDFIEVMDQTDKDCVGDNKRKETVSMFFFETEVCIVQYMATWTDARTYPGNSGSPVINRFGNVVGVLFAGDAYANGYLVPLREVQDFLANF